MPCYLFTVIPAPYFKKYGKRPDVIAFVDGVTAAAIGSIAGAVIVIGAGIFILYRESRRAVDAARKDQSLTP